MAKQDCEICQGRGVVRLPIYSRLSAVYFQSELTVEQMPRPSSREYGCPECGLAVNEGKVAVLDAHVMVDTRAPAEYEVHARRNAAHRLVDMLLERDYITFSTYEHNSRDLKRPVVATLAVVSKGAAAAMEERLRQRQDQLAKAVADEAIKQIDNWGSHYGRAAVSKEDAGRFIRVALNDVSKDWSAAKALVS